MKFSLRDKIVGAFAAVCFVLLAVAATLPQPLYVGAFQGDGSQLTNMTGTGNFTIITNTSFAYITNLNVSVISNVNDITFQTNVVFNYNVTGKGQVNITNVTIGAPGGLTNLNLTANSLMKSDNNDAETSVANAYGVLTNNGSGGIAWSAAYPQADGAAITNLTYRYETNNTGSTTLNWGLAYRTNIAANVTLALQSVTANPNSQFYETIVYWATNSSGSDFKTTWPSGVIGPVGSGTPSVLYCTNKTVTRILVEHYGPNDITVSKTDFGN